MIYLLILLLSFDLFYFAGILVLAFMRIHPESGFAGTFVRVFTGMVACTVAYAFFTSGFVTVMLGCVFIIMCVILIRRSEKGGFIIFSPDMFRQEYRNAPYVFGAMLLLFAWHYFYVFATASGSPLIISGDNLFAANLATWMNYSGVETLDWNYIQTPNGVSPYHYFEGWLTAMLTGIFGGHSWFMVQMVVVPLLQLLAVCGVWSLIERKKFKWLWVPAGFLVIFISAFYTGGLQNFSLFLWSGSYGENGFEQPWMLKMLVVYLVILMVILYVSKRKYTEAIGLLMLIPVFSITLAPSVLGTAFIFILIDILFKGKLTGKALKPVHLLLPVVTGAYILYFYYSFSSSEAPVPVEYDLNALFSLFNFKTILYKILVAAAMFLPYLLLIIIANLFRGRQWTSELIRSYSFRTVVVFCFLFFVSAFYTWKIFEPIFGSFEFFYYAIVPVFSVIIYVVALRSILALESKVKTIVLGSLILIFALFFCSRSVMKSLELRAEWDKYYDVSFLEKAGEKMENSNPVGLKMERKEEMKEEFLNPNVNACGTFLNHQLEPFSLVSVTVARMLAEEGPGLNISERMMMSRNPLWCYMQENGFKNDWRKGTLAFMRDNKIEYLVLSDSVVADSLFLPFIDTCMKDKNSGETFIKLKLISK
ncbi:MAG: hypothetical protein V2A54_02845 [Bacteroidota bacterium]